MSEMSWESADVWDDIWVMETEEELDEIDATHPAHRTGTHDDEGTGR